MPCVFTGTLASKIHHDKPKPEWQLALGPPPQTPLPLLPPPPPPPLRTRTRPRTPQQAWLQPGAWQLPLAWPSLLRGPRPPMMTCPRPRRQRLPPWRQLRRMALPWQHWLLAWQPLPWAFEGAVKGQTFVWMIRPNQTTVLISTLTSMHRIAFNPMPTMYIGGSTKKPLQLNCFWSTNERLRDPLVSISDNHTLSCPVFLP